MKDYENKKTDKMLDNLELKKIKRSTLHDSNFLLMEIKHREKRKEQERNCRMEFFKVNKKLSCSQIPKSYILNNSKLWIEHGQELNNCLKAETKDKPLIIKKPQDLQSDQQKIIEAEINYKDLIMKELKSSLPVIEKKIKNNRRIAALKSEIEKIELTHIEGKLKEQNMSLFEVENIDQISKKRRKAMVVPNKHQHHASPSENQSNSQDENLSGTIFDYMTIKSDFANHSKHNLEDNFDEDEEKLLQNFIMEEEILKDKTLSNYRTVLGRDVAKKVRIDNDVDQYYTKRIIEFKSLKEKEKKFEKQSQIKHIDEETKTKTNYISNTTSTINKVLSIIYPNLMNKKQEKINREVQKIKEKIKRQKQQKSVLATPNSNSSSNLIFNSNCILSKSRMIGRGKIRTHSTGFNQVNENTFDLNAAIKGKSSANLLNNLVSIETFCIKAREFDEAIFSPKYYSNRSTLSAVRSKLNI